MGKGVCKAANAILLLATALSLGHLAFWLYITRPRPPVIGSIPLQFREDRLGPKAYLLAVLCQELINKRGELPKDPRELTRVISDRAKELGNDWPGEYKINSAGEICDSFGQPFQISVRKDRVIVTSPSLLTYYFAGLKSPPSLE